jgi:hypothetical protein
MRAYISNDVVQRKEDQEAVEIATRDQSAGSEWKKQRAGRITGTKIKRVSNFKF